MSLRRIGPFDVAPIGLGCMNLSHAYGEPPSPEAAERLVQSVSAFKLAAAG